MQYDYFPVTLDDCSASIRFHDLVEGSFELEDIKVSTRYLNHPALTLAYRLEADGATVVYACDHEPHGRIAAVEGGELTEQDRRHAEFMEGADLLIHDAQYTAAEYPDKIGWGHSPIEYVVALGRYARVKRVALTHHDPLKDDDAIDRMIATVRQRPSPPFVFAAFEGQVVELEPSQLQGPAARGRERCAEMPVESASGERPVLLDVADPRTAGILGEAFRAEGICPKPFLSMDTASTLIAQEHPWLAILEHDPPRIDGIDICRAIRSLTKDYDRPLPILMVVEQENQHAATAAGVTDWLIKPFTVAHARTKIGTWMLRIACQSIRSDASTGQQSAVAATEVLQAEHANGPHETTTLHPPLEKGMDRCPSEMISQSDKSALLWMYGREIAPFDTPAFNSHVGEIIARSTRAPQKRVARRQTQRRAKVSPWY
jgi:CheY-like chemotaxis protein